MQLEKKTGRQNKESKVLSLTTRGNQLGLFYSSRAHTG